MSEKKLKAIGFIGKDILAVAQSDTEKALVEAGYHTAELLRQKDVEIERHKVAFRTVYEELENAREAIEEKDALIKELASALAERLKPDKIRTLLDRVTALSPGHPQRRAAEMDVQQMPIGRHEMDRQIDADGRGEEMER